MLGLAGLNAAQLGGELAKTHNVTRDPLELTNLAHSTDPSVQAAIGQLKTLLHTECEAKMLKPGTGPVPGQPGC